MTTHPASARTSPAPFAVAGAAALGIAIYHVATPGPPEPSYDGVLDFVREGLTLALVGGGAIAAVAAWRAGLAPRVGALLIAVGYGLIFVGVAIGAALRDDPDWFLLLGGPGQLLSMAGFITWAVWGRRTGTLSWSLALLCGIGGTVAFLGSEVGLAVLLAGFWFGLVPLLRRGPATTGATGSSPDRTWTGA